MKAQYNVAISSSKKVENEVDATIYTTLGGGWINKDGKGITMRVPSQVSAKEFLLFPTVECKEPLVIGQSAIVWAVTKQPGSDSFWTRVGTVFPMIKKDGDVIVGIRVVAFEGILLSGELSIRLRKPIESTNS